MNAPTQASQLKPEPLHKPFSWLDDSLKGNYDAEFVAMVKTFCHGIESCLSIIHSNNMLVCNGEAAMLSEFDSDALLMLAGASAKMLAGAAEENIEFMRDRANPLPAASGSKK